MARIGFWQLLLDDRVSYWERNAINGAYDQAEIAAGQAEAASFTIGQLQARMTTMGREIVMLRAALTVLVNTLRDTNVLNPALLEARLEAALEEASPPPPPQTTATAVAPRPYVCIKCRQEVAAAATTMTADGPVCDRCLR